MNITILLKRWIIIIRLLSQRLLSPAFWINININYCTASLGCYMMLSAWLLGRNSLRIQSIQLNLKLVHWHWPRKLRYLIALNLIIVNIDWLNIMWIREIAATTRSSKTRSSKQHINFEPDLTGVVFLYF